MTVLALVAACGSTSGSNDAGEGESSASQQDALRTPAGYTAVQDQGLEIDQEISLTDEAIYAPYVHVKVSTLGTAETVRFKGEERQPADGETFYVAQLEVVPDPYDSEVAKNSKDSELDLFPYVAVQTAQGEDQIDLEGVKRSIVDGAPEPETYTVVASGSDRNPPMLFVGDYNRIWQQTLNLATGKFEEDSATAVEPVTIEIDESYNGSSTADLRTSSDADLTHQGTFDTARISSFPLDNAYEPSKNIVSVEASLRFDISGFDGTEIAYHPAESARLVDDEGNTYPGLLHGSNSEHFMQFGETEQVTFQFAVPSDARAFTLDYEPSATLVGAEEPGFSAEQIPVDFGSD